MANDTSILDATSSTVEIRTLDSGNTDHGRIQVFQESIAGADGSESLVSPTNPKPVYFPNTPTITISGAVSVTGTFWQATQPISAASLPLPANAAKETGGNLDTLIARTPALGQALAAASVPVVLTAAQIATLTPPSSVTISGTTAVSIASMPSTPVTGTFWQATQPVSGTFWQATQPVSGTVTANVGTTNGLALDATLTGGTQLARTNAKRNAGATHRSAITAVDKITAPGTPSSGTDVTSGGSLAQGTNHYMAFAFGNKYGTTGVSNISAAIATAASGGSVHCVKATGAAASGGTPEYVDIFMSTSSTAPLWVGRCTYTQFTNANGVIVTAVGTVTAGSSLGAQVVQVNVLGTGLASNVLPFTVNNAYVPDSLSAINCAGYSLAHIKCALAVTDLRSLPTLTVVPFLLNQIDSFYDQGQPMSMGILSATGQPLRQDFVMQLDGSTGLVVCVDAISGQGASLTCVVELA